MGENGKGVILLVEDNRDDEDLAARALRRRGVGNPIMVCRDGAEALEFIFGAGNHAGRSPSDTPAVTMLDLKLPRVDGLAVLQRIRADERTRLMPVVVFTSSNQESDILNCYEAGANSYVRKPVDFEQLIDAVHHVADYWLRLNQPLSSEHRCPATKEGSVVS